MQRVKQEAERYVSLGYNVIPMGRDKKPAVKWKRYQSERTVASQFRWEANVAIVTGAISRLVVLDFEEVETARVFWRGCGAVTPMVVRSPRGIHLYYRHPGERVRNGQRIQSCDATYDVRGDGGYVLAPPSVNKGKPYEWLQGPVKAEKLPVFKMQWRPNNERKECPNVSDAVKYITRIVAVEGEGGSAATWRAVNVIREAGYDETTCLSVMTEWNQTNAQPPWSQRELLRKVRDAYRAT